MAHSDRQSPTKQPLGFDYDEGHAEQGLTALAGIPVLLQAFRSLDLPGSVKRHMPVKQRQRCIAIIQTRRDSSTRSEPAPALSQIDPSFSADSRSPDSHSSNRRSDPDFYPIPPLSTEIQPLNDGLRGAESYA